MQDDPIESTQPIQLLASGGVRPGGEDDEARVRVLGGQDVRVERDRAHDDFLLTRVMELVVHTDDLAVSLGLPTPPMPQTATEATIRLLSSLAAWRHGCVNVIRALARPERSPTSISAL
ncbi:hypothetical protein AB0J27_10650 [Micromonospora chokoriensis]